MGEVMGSSKSQFIDLKYITKSKFTNMNLCIYIKYLKYVIYSNGYWYVIYIYSWSCIWRRNIKLFLKCDGCNINNPLTLKYALQLKIGILVTGRHNEVHDSLGLTTAQDPTSYYVCENQSYPQVGTSQEKNN